MSQMNSQLSAVGRFERDNYYAQRDNSQSGVPLPYRPVSAPASTRVTPSASTLYPPGIPQANPYAGQAGYGLKVNALKPWQANEQAAKQQAFMSQWQQDQQKFKGTNPGVPLSPLRRAPGSNQPDDQSFAGEGHLPGSDTLRGADLDAYGASKGIPRGHVVINGKDYGARSDADYAGLIRASEQGKFNASRGYENDPGYQKAHSDLGMANAAVEEGVPPTEYMRRQNMTPAQRQAEETQNDLAALDPASRLKAQQGLAATQINQDRASETARHNRATEQQALVKTDNDARVKTWNNLSDLGKGIVQGLEKGLTGLANWAKSNRKDSLDQDKLRVQAEKAWEAVQSNIRKRPEFQGTQLLAADAADPAKKTAWQDMEKERQAKLADALTRARTEFEARMPGIYGNKAASGGAPATQPATGKGSIMVNGTAFTDNGDGTITHPNGSRYRVKDGVITEKIQ